MNEYTAQIFVKDTIFSLTHMISAPHLWEWCQLSEVGIFPELIPELSRTLGIDSSTVKLTLTLRELTCKVAQESPLEVQLIKRGFFDLFI